MLRSVCTSAVVLFLMVTSTAFAQDRVRAAQPQVEAAVGASFEDFAAAVRGAAEEAGAVAPDDAELREAFSAADANGDGRIDSGEASARTAPPTNCSGRGVCQMGRCFCLSASSDEGPAVDNPTFEAAPAALENAIGD